MPIAIAAGHSTLLIRRSAFERAGLTRSLFDDRLGLTENEFQVEHELVCIGPVVDDAALASLIETLESRGLVHFEHYFDLSGNWPAWLELFAMARRSAASPEH